MKIAIYHNVPPGGARRTVYEQIRHLSQKHKVDLYTTSPIHRQIMDPSDFCDNWYDFDFKLEIDPQGVKKRFIRDYKNFFLLKRVHKKIADIINQGGYDFALIHTDEYTEAPFILRFLRIPSIYHCHEPLRIAYEEKYKFKEKVNYLKYMYEIITRYVRKNIDRINLKSADAIITSSKYIGQKVKRYYNKDSYLCYPGVDTDVFKPCDKRINQTLFIGSKIESEGYQFAVKLISSLPPDIRPTLKVLDFNDRRTKINDDRMLAKEYSRSITMLCLDYEEPFGLKAIEAMACQTPVLAVNDGGYTESVENGFNGYLLNRDINQFKDHLLNFVNNRGLVEKMGKNGRSSAIKKWQWSRHAKDIVNIARKLSKEYWD